MVRARAKGVPCGKANRRRSACVALERRKPYIDPSTMASKGKKADTPEILNRKARFNYAISETLEVGIKLTGTEARSIRGGKCSLAEGYVRAEAEPPTLSLHSVHIDEYAPAGPAAGGRQHNPTRVRTLLAHAREIVKLADATQEKGVTIVPLKIYFKSGRAKLLIGVGRGKRQSDKRQDIRSREADRDMRRAMTRRM